MRRLLLFCPCRLGACIRELPYGRKAAPRALQPQVSEQQATQHTQGVVGSVPEKTDEIGKTLEAPQTTGPCSEDGGWNRQLASRRDRRQSGHGDCSAFQPSAFGALFWILLIAR